MPSTSTLDWTTVAESILDNCSSKHCAQSIVETIDTLIETQDVRETFFLNKLQAACTSLYEDCTIFCRLLQKGLRKSKSAQLILKELTNIEKILHTRRTPMLSCKDLGLLQSISASECAATESDTLTKNSLDTLIASNDCSIHAQTISASMNTPFMDTPFDDIFRQGTPADSCTKTFDTVTENHFMCFFFGSWQCIATESFAAESFHSSL